MAIGYVITSWFANMWFRRKWAQRKNRLPRRLVADGVGTSVLGEGWSIAQGPKPGPGLVSYSALRLGVAPPS